MRNRLLCMLGVAVLVLATGLAAQTTDPAMTTQTISGKVISSSSTSLVIETDTGTRQTFVVDAQSNLPSGLTPGSRISVDYHTLSGGTYHAARATTLSAAATPAQPTTEARPVEPATTPDTTTAPVDTTPDTSSTMGTTTDTDTTKKTTRRMPATASPLPLVGLVGLASLVAGAALRRFGAR